MNLAAQYFNSPYRVLKTIHESPRPECPLLAHCGGSRHRSMMRAIEVEADGRETQSSATSTTIWMVGDVVDVPES
jgi:hypothetical protein